MKQAASASRAAEALMGGEDSSKEKDEELKKAKTDLQTMKTQSENLTKEYDRLLEEKDKLERRLRIVDGNQGDKKDD